MWVPCPRPCCHHSEPKTLSLALPSRPLLSTPGSEPHLTAAPCVASRAEAAGTLGPILAGCLVSAGAGQEAGRVGGRSGTWGRAVLGRWAPRKGLPPREGCGVRGSCTPEEVEEKGLCARSPVCAAGLDPSLTVWALEASGTEAGGGARPVHTGSPVEARGWREEAVSRGWVSCLSPDL